MDKTAAPGPSPPEKEKQYLTVRQAALIGSVVALLIFTFITAAHFQVRGETGASALVLTIAIVAAGGVLLAFVFTTLIHEPASMVTLGAILVLSIGLDFWWKRIRGRRTGQPSPGREA